VKEKKQMATTTQTAVNSSALELALQIFPDVRSIKTASFNQKESAPAAHLRGIPYELIVRRDAIAVSE
jgi:hypothetical protein